MNLSADPLPKEAGITWTVDGGSVQGPVSPRNFDPIPLLAGPHTVCWRVEDRAGLSDVGNLANQCRSFTVDLDDPTTTLTPTGTLGNNGWYTSQVSVERDEHRPDARLWCRQDVRVRRRRTVRREHEPRPHR